MKRYDLVTMIQEDVKAVLTDERLTHEQVMMKLALIAQNVMPYPEGTPEAFYPYFDEGLLCDLSEGHAPYCPRYILPDYEKLLREGSAYLRLDPARDLYEAINHLLIMYRHVPSVTHFPVYLGHLDQLLEPFITDEVAAVPLIRGLLLQMDRTLGSSFCHVNIGPKPTRAGRILLQLEKELQNSIPNMTLLYDPEITDDTFAGLAVEAALACANPAFANHKNYVKDFGNSERYGIASCYNGLPVAGGAFTLSRIRLCKIAYKAVSVEDFFEHQLVDVAYTLCKFMEAKIDWLVQETPFFTSHFLVKEKFVELDRFVGLFGVVGLAECCNELMKKQGSTKRFGIDDEANEMGVRVLERLKEIVEGFESKYGAVWHNRFMLHSQVGAEGDEGVSPGTRIPIGEEPPLYIHLAQAGLYHKYFTSGVGDHFPFDQTADGNVPAILDIIKGAYQVGMRYISVYGEASDLVRVTGFLVKKSDLARYREGGQVINETVGGSVDSDYGRKVRNLAEEV